MLPAETFRRRHLLLCWVLGLHIPALFLFGLWQGFSVSEATLEMATPAICLFAARTVDNRRLAAFFVTAGLVFCSSVLVHFSGGMIESHFHFFVLIGLIALYQDWVPFLWNVVFTVLSHGMGSALAADSMFNHHAGQNNPWTWALIHGVAVLAACVGVLVFWKNTEQEQQIAGSLASELAASEVASAHAEAAQRRSVSELLVNLARRNQSLLDRQLALIAELEQRERDPEPLAELFQLDHLATRIRRNAESLLVLSGDEPPRLWGQPMPLAEVVRAAAAEIEHYKRVDIEVNDYLDVAGQIVADLAHLLAELIENATTFSPPSSRVRVRTHVIPSEWSTMAVSVEDTGMGMSDTDMIAANEVLAYSPEVDLRSSTLGFHVVSRLARRYGMQVRLAHTPGGGVTAMVALPNTLVSERTLPAPAPQPRATLEPATATLLPHPPPPSPPAPADPDLPSIAAPAYIAPILPSSVPSARWDAPIGPPIGGPAPAPVGPVDPGLAEAQPFPGTPPLPDDEAVPPPAEAAELAADDVDLGLDVDVESMPAGEPPPRLTSAFVPPVAEPEPALEPFVEPEAWNDPEPELEPAVAADTGSEAQPWNETETQAWDEPEPEPAVAADTEAWDEPEPEPAVAAAADTDSEAQAWDDTEPEAEPAVAADTETWDEPEIAVAAEAEAEPAAEAEPEPTADDGSEPAVAGDGEPEAWDDIEAAGDSEDEPEAEAAVAESGPNAWAALVEAADAEAEPELVPELPQRIPRVPTEPPAPPPPPPPPPTAPPRPVAPAFMTHVGEPAVPDPVAAVDPSLPELPQRVPRVAPPYVAPVAVEADEMGWPAPQTPPLSTDAPAPPPPPPSNGGLARRVPGASLAPSLRRSEESTDGDGSGEGGAFADRERVRSMLSQFQSGQTAGRAATGTPDTEDE